jgi:hypothetical protein
LVGFNGKEGETTSSSKEFKYPTAGGETKITTDISATTDYYKDFLSLNEISKDWSLFYIIQRSAQVTTPYLFIGFTEVAVVIVFFTII